MTDTIQLLQSRHVSILFPCQLECECRIAAIECSWHELRRFQIYDASPMLVNEILDRPSYIRKVPSGYKSDCFSLGQCSLRPKWLYPAALADSTKASNDPCA